MLTYFNSIDHARELASEWMHEYNYERPHSALGNKTPIEFKLWRASQFEAKRLAETPADVGVELSFKAKDNFNYNIIQI
jgi:hypothetical protein